MLKLVFSSLSKQALNSYKTYLTLHLTKYKINYKLVDLPKSKHKYTLLKSPHVNKKSKETFELVQYKFFLVLDSDGKCFNLLKNNLPKLIHLKWSFVKQNSRYSKD
jgi:ribosomal protein S10